TWGDVAIDQLRAVTTVNLNEPRWVTVIDKFTDLQSGVGLPTGGPSECYHLNSPPAAAKWAERRVVHINAAGYILSDRRWGMTPGSNGQLVGDVGLGESSLYDSKNRIIERRSAGWSALPVDPPSERLTKGLIYTFQYADTPGIDATKPSQIGVKWGTAGAVQPISDFTYHAERPEIAHTEVSRPTTNPTDAVVTETLLDTEVVPDSPVTAHRIAARLSLKPAVTVASGSLLYRTIDGEGYLPDGRLRWKARGQINAAGATRVAGDSVVLDVMVYADDLPPGTLPPTAPSTSLCASIEDAEEGASVLLPGLGVSFTVPAIDGDFAWLSRYATTVAGASGPAPAANRATAYVYGDFGLSRVYYPDGRRQYVFADVGSNEIEQRLYDDVVVGGSSSSFQTLKSGRIIRTTMSGKLLETKTVDWIASSPEPTGSESYTTVFTQTASTDDNGRLTALSRTTAGTTDTLAASVVFGIGSQVERSQSPEGLVTRNLYDPRGRLTRVFAGTADLDDYWSSGVPSSSPAGDNMVMTERRSYGTGVTDALELTETR
ncbi:MAG TPA: hypothetical protein VEB22_14530, partial [Phycisphaerales bacterium]|nr:hypothetical protein [Phycisphaerales bacterium]